MRGLEEWQATPVAVLDVRQEDLVLVDSCVVSTLYGAHRKRNFEHPWYRLLLGGQITPDRRVVTSITRWELARRNTGSEWTRWFEAQFRSQEIDERTLREFHRVLTHV